MIIGDPSQPNTFIGIKLLLFSICKKNNNKKMSNVVLFVFGGFQIYTFTGALASAQHRDKVKHYAELAVKEGGRVLLGGKTPVVPAG